MKVGDLVKCKPGVWLGFGEGIRIGVIIDVDEFDESGLWYHIKWDQESLWHSPGDLEVISESR
mgnify:CR=1 FL=1|jgi:hypothetical protein